MKKLIYTLTFICTILLAMSVFLKTDFKNSFIFLSKQTNTDIDKVNKSNSTSNDTNDSDEAVNDKDVDPDSENNQRIVIIDPGHGAIDPGSLGKKGSLEKDINLAVALKLGPILEAKGYKVIYTRKNDNLDMSNIKEDLLRRADVANDADADLFVSIHCNASDLNNISGTETYYHNTSSKGKKIAEIIQDEVIKQVKFKDRGIKTEDFSVLRNVEAPSILIELGYISTPSEEDKLKNSSYQNKFAQGIANGIFKYFEDR